MPEPRPSAAGDPAGTGSSSASRLGTASVVTLAAAIVVVSLNLRPAIVAVGPLANEIESGDGLNTVAASLLTTVPVLCLGLFAAAAPLLARRIGFERGVLAALALIVGGIALRLLSPVAALFAGTAVAGGGIAVANVLVPALIKRDFPRRLGAMMSTYSVALQSGAALASGATVPLGSALGAGWRTSLALWGLPAALAIVVWLPHTAHRRAAEEPDGPRYRVWRSGLGWACAAFIGLQSAVYFSLTAWLPSLLHDHGMSQGRAGVMLSVVGVAGILGGLPMPLLAARRGDQRLLVAATVTEFGVGLAGLLADPVPFALVWAIALGLAQGGALSLALTLFTLRSHTADGAAQLGAMAQAAGYLIAAAGPLAAGSLHALTGTWTVPLAVLLAVLAPLTRAGWACARPRFLEDEADTTAPRSAEAATP